MKRFILLSLLILLTGCTKTKVCEIKTDDYSQKWKYIFKEEKISGIDLNITYSNSIFGDVDSLNVLSDDEKEILKNQILSNMGLEKDSYEGLKIDIKVTDEINVIVKIDTQKVPKELLEKIGLKINTEDLNINKVVKEMTENGAVCK